MNLENLYAMTFAELAEFMGIDPEKLIQTTDRIGALEMAEDFLEELEPNLEKYFGYKAWLVNHHDLNTNSAEYDLALAGYEVDEEPDGFYQEFLRFLDS